MDSGHYRGIALNSVYSKLLDNIIVYRYGDRLNSSELQFAFKAKSSTNMCTMVRKETMSYYTKHQSSVYCAFLDATKAFDRVNYCKLFRLLLKRDLPACVIRVLINCYVSNYARVTWNGVFSEYFLVKKWRKTEWCLTGRLHGPIVGPTGRSDWSVRPVG